MMIVAIYNLVVSFQSEYPEAQMFDQFSKTKLYETKGYCMDLKLSSQELDTVRSLVTKQYLETIEKTNPEQLSQFQEHGIENYHKLSHLVEHSKLWPKPSRCLPEEDCLTIKSLPFWQALKDEFGHFRTGEVVYEKNIEWGRDEMYWRIVRPHSPNDVGTLHADRWFHETMQIRERAFPKNGHALKIWIPLYVEPGKSGLAIIPGSHKEDWKYRTVEIENTYKPRLDGDESQVDTELLKTQPGDVVIFNEDLVHVGAVSKGEQTRISLEITLIKA